ncbi:MAG TPA: carboxylesterase/lipase family protein [Dehalococcoidia bacterium]|nr:carboxylesterase/lipase family protein [Dehalococcoidia bacterium]
MSSIVETTAGKVEGFKKENLHVFLGIPFAAPPVGERRWLAPQPLEPWAGVKEAKAFVAIAPQIIAPPDPNNPLQTGFKVDTSIGEQPAASEDCLYLNIWTPAPDNNRRPVMFWIHGGGFTGGSGASPMYNGSVYAGRGDVVVVSINYRLNVFGFLRLNEVTGGRIPSTGNEGMLDQVAALEWVRDNIGAFGGDPDNITIFGESAGGGSVSALMGMPAAKGLFHKVISQSGSAHFMNHSDDADRYAEHLLGLMGISGNDSDALQGLTMEQVLRAYVKSLNLPKGIRGPMPVVDGEIFPQQPIDSIKAGSVDGVPLMAGSNTDEWRLWQVLDPAIEGMVEGHMLARFRRMAPTWDISETIEAYREILAGRGVPVTPTEIFLAVMTARMFWIPTLKMVDAQAGRSNPAYCYLFNWGSPAKDGMFGACHAMDLGFIWNSYETAFFGPGPAADTLARNMQDAWLAFARTGNPACEGLGKWPVCGERRETMILGEKSGIENAPLEEERLIWDSAPDEAFRWG